MKATTNVKERNKRERILSLFGVMLRIRLFEERVKELYREQEIFGAVHLYIGQEAIAAGVCSALRDSDSVFSTHRGHGHYIAKTGDARGALAELMGRATGCSKGCGGSMHMFNTEKGFMGSNGIVGGGIPLALGAAFTALYRGNDNVSIAFFGDGASNQGTFHESLNLAALKKLPLIAVFENNRYAATTPVADAMSSENMGGRAKGYGIPSLTIDGNDAEAVAQAAEKAVEHARKGKGPFVLDCRTYRIEPHCGIIADSRPKEELEIWRRDDKDPLNLIANNNSGILTRAKIEKIKKATALEIDDAVEFARKSPMPSVDDFIEEWGVA